MPTERCEHYKPHPRPYKPRNHTLCLTLKHGAAATDTANWAIYHDRPLQHLTSWPTYHAGTSLTALVTYTNTDRSEARATHTGSTGALLLTSTPPPPPPPKQHYDATMVRPRTTPDPARQALTPSRSFHLGIRVPGFEKIKTLKSLSRPSPSRCAGTTHPADNSATQ